MSTALQARLQPLLDHPLHQHLGLKAVSGEAGVGRLTLRVTEAVSSPAGGFHGGVIYLLCDVCGYAGLLSVLDEASHAVTHDIQVSVMRAAALGDAVDFESRVVRLGRRLAFIEVRVSVRGETLATAKITKSVFGA